MVLAVVSPLRYIVSMSVALYRHFSKNGELLYVGVSRNPFERLADHVRRGDWTSEIAAITLQWFDDADMALDAEKLAINVEKPRWNVSTQRSGNGGRPRIGDTGQTLSATKPWLSEGISRATWYRRQKENREA